MEIKVGNSEPLIASILGIITIGLYTMVLSGRWSSKNR
jgi:hypothetical protein